MDPEDDPSVHRLEASAPATGGLVLKKKDADTSTFKVPKPSMLGLDRLAAQKRKEREDQKRLVSFKDNEYDDETATPDHNTVKTPDMTSVHKLSRNYRESKSETPSHGGGVSDKARDRLAKISEKEKRGVYVSTKDEKRSRNKDDRNYDRRDRDRHRDRERDRGRGKDSDRRREKDRDYDRRRDRSERDGSRHSNRSRRPSDSERSLHTPRFRDEPKTPNFPAVTGSTSWDDDDEKPMKRSSWDFPTPKDYDKRSEWSTRSNTSSIYRMKKGKMEDDTPRPTPAHRFNAWANDRKRSGATPHTSTYFNFKSLLTFYEF